MPSTTRTAKHSTAAAAAAGKSAAALPDSATSGVHAESLFYKSKQLPVQRKRNWSHTDSDDDTSSLPAAPSDDDSEDEKPGAKTHNVRKRTDPQRYRAAYIKVFFRTMEDALRFMLGESTIPARPLPSDRFDLATVDSVLNGPNYVGNAIGFPVPVWIAGDSKPIFVEVMSKKSSFFRRLPMSCPHIDPAAHYSAQREAAAKLCAPTKGIRKPQRSTGPRRSSSAAAEAAASASSASTLKSTKATKPTAKPTKAPAKPAKRAKLAKTASSASSASTDSSDSASASAASASAATFALTFGEPSCLGAHVLGHNGLACCSLCGQGDSDVSPKPT
jgi:hypothetical protein